MLLLPSLLREAMSSLKVESAPSSPSKTGAKIPSKKHSNDIVRGHLLKLCAVRVLSHLRTVLAVLIVNLLFPRITQYIVCFRQLLERLLSSYTFNAVKGTAKQIRKKCPILPPITRSQCTAALRLRYWRLINKNGTTINFSVRTSCLMPWSIGSNVSGMNGWKCRKL